MKVLLLERAFSEIEKHALCAYPEECCGLMIAELPENFGEPDCELEVLETRPLSNAWESKAKTHRYLLDPDAMARVEREFAGTSRGIVGIYHSHPDVAAWPSPFDLDHAWPSYAYLILSVRAGKPAEARVWQLSEDGHSFEEGSLKKVRETCFAKMSDKR